MPREYLVGKTILGYKVIDIIGEGGFGTVYKAVKDNDSGQYIRAIKHITLPNENEYGNILNSMGGDKSKTEKYFTSCLENIVDEIKIMDELSRRGANNIVVYYDHDIKKSYNPLRYDIFIIMEYLIPYSKYVNTNVLKVSDVIHLGLDILSALKICHENGIIHRDIKEDNIFIAEHNRKLTYKIGDFGVSKLLGNNSRAMSMKGTPNYIAPEVYLEKEKYNKSVDLYSLGIVMYKLLNHSRYPFLPKYPEEYNDYQQQEAFERRIKGDIPDLPEQCSEELGKIIVKSISSKKERYENAEGFYNDLIEVMKKSSQDQLDIEVNKSVQINKQYSYDDFDFKLEEETVGAKIELTENDEEVESNNKESFGEYGTGLEFTYIKDNIKEKWNQRISEINDEDNKVLKEENQKKNKYEEAVDNRQKDNKLKKTIIYLTPVITAVIGLLGLMIIFNLQVKTRYLSVFLKNFAYFSKNIVVLKVWTYLILVIFMVSLYVVGRELNKNKRIKSTSTISGKREGYYLAIDIVSSLVIMNRNEGQKSLSKIINKFNVLEEKLKRETDFGYGDEAISNIENEIIRKLRIIKESIENEDINRVIKNINNLEATLLQIENLLNKRREMYKVK